MVGFEGSNGGMAPSGVITDNLGGAGRPKPLSKVARSLAMVGDPYESTRAMVSPVPVRCC
jgi:hypothetical protein